MANLDESCDHANYIIVLFYIDILRKYLPVTP